jgi:hypothetical protein
VENANEGKQYQPHRRNNCVGGNIGLSAEGNDQGKVNKYKIIYKAVFILIKVVPPKKAQITNKNRIKYVSVKVVPFLSHVLGEHADPHHDIGDSHQERTEHEKKTWVEE